MKEIELTQGSKAIVDDEDYEYLNQWKWHDSTGYAMRHNSKLFKETGKRRLLKMHRVILDAPDHMQVDHINRNKLDNRRSNLRLCTKRQNNINILGKNGQKSRGVQFYNNRYVAKLRIDGKQKYIGCFKTEEEAAQAYNEYAYIYHGEFAVLNRYKEPKL